MFFIGNMGKGNIKVVQMLSNSGKYYRALSLEPFPVIVGPQSHSSAVTVPPGRQVEGRTRKIPNTVSIAGEHVHTV